MLGLAEPDVPETKGDVTAIIVSTVSRRGYNSRSAQNDEY